VIIIVKLDSIEGVAFEVDSEDAEGMNAGGGTGVNGLIARKKGIYYVKSVLFCDLRIAYLDDDTGIS
jgi:hypothetical protein